MKKFNEYIKESLDNGSPIQDLFMSNDRKLLVPMSMNDLFGGAEIVLLKHDGTLLMREADDHDWSEFTMEEFKNNIHPDILEEPNQNHLIDHLTTAITSFYTMYYSVATTED